MFYSFYLTSLGKVIKGEACEHLSPFRNDFYKFNNTGARMLDSIYHMTFKHYFQIFGRYFRY